ncbi:amidohydrolase family protein [Actinomyces glycerinitolerans]|uniref:Metal-dependent hydrolase n=1 Tax=Actinomyces glycerinitolerans TaxID=1892869 RepID=A0A1M4RXU0_9ACTO|nr:amidohydrolase family protein [Actinomyces glycerinitolerans]SHE24804.1 metal-dependent hydrolase [Actinomyces glycerinitolerans]
MIIDANMYWFPEELFTDAEALDRFISEVPRAFDINVYRTCKDGINQLIVEKPAGFPALNYVQGDYVLQTMLADMDAAGVDKAVLKVPGCNEWMSLEMCRRFNDGMAAYAESTGSRMAPLAVVPAIGGPRVDAEIHRCLDDLGFAGVQLCAHYGNHYLDDTMFAPLFETLNDAGATVYVHHVPVPVEARSLLGYNNLRRSYGRCQDQITAVGRELFSDFFMRYPRLKMVHSMLGGGFFAIQEMLLPRPSMRQEAVQRFQADDGSLAQRLRDHVYFEMSHAQPWGTAALECAVKVLGADHIVWGTSYPVRKEWLLDGPAFVRSLDITDEDKDLILAGNANALYRLDS